MPRPVTPEMIDAVETLRAYAQGHTGEAARAIDVRDNADFFADIDGAADEQTESTPLCAHCSDPLDDQGG